MNIKRNPSPKGSGILEKMEKAITWVNKNLTPQEMLESLKITFNLNDKNIEELRECFKKTYDKEPSDAEIVVFVHYISIIRRSGC